MKGKYLIKQTVVLTFMLLLPVAAQAQNCSQSQLHDEFFLDQTQRGYVTCSSDGDLANPNTTSDVCVEQKFNAPCTNNANCKVDNILTREQIYQTIIDANELDTLANDTSPAGVKHKTELGWLLNADSWNMAINSSQKQWKNPFPAATAPITNAAIDGAKLRDAPRSQIVCGRVGTLTDVSCGLRGACQ
jgi:hypothetical protein